MSAPHVLVVGAGVGGLTSAALLAHAGYRVTVVEKNHEAGGRASRLVKDGFHFDMGPTILLMPDVYDRFFAALGRRTADYVKLRRMETNYRVFFADGEQLDVTPDTPAMHAGLERIEKGAAAQFDAFMAKSGERYHRSRREFVERRYDHLFQFINPASVKTALELGALGKLYKDVSGHFRDERLRATFSFQSMYLGTSPTDSPATFSLLPYTELAEGILFPEGGIYALIQAFERVGREEGVEFRYDTAVEKVLEGPDRRATGVRLAGGEVIEADLVLVNADLAAAAGTLVDEPRRFERAKFTSSGVMFYIGLDRKLPGFEHHNVFFGEKYLPTFDELFRDGRMPSDPAFYVALPNRSDPALAPPGGEAMYVLIPCPSLPADGSTPDPELARLREQVLDRVSERAGFDVRAHIVTETPFTPTDWKERFALARGSCFGLAHDMFRVAALRPAPKSPVHPNVYYVGASTRPGTGVPLVMIGAELVTQQIAEEHPVVAPDWEGCAEVTREHAKTFSFAARFLPGEVRRAAQAIYAFFRRIDDVVDEGGPETLPELVAAMDRMAAGGPAPDGKAAAMAEIMRRYRIDWGHVRSLVRGVSGDQGRVRLRSWPALYAYCYRVAGVVGLVMAPILGARLAAATGPAVQLGVAMQLTNILRDVGEDLDRDRVYLPLDELADHGLGADALFARELAPAEGPVDPRWAGFMQGQIARARAYFRHGYAGLGHLRPFSARLTAAVMGVLYEDILTSIEQSGYRVFDRRNRVSTLRKLALLPKALGLALSPSTDLGPAPVAMASRPARLSLVEDAARHAG